MFIERSYGFAPDRSFEVLAPKDCLGCRDCTGICRAIQELMVVPSAALRRRNQAFTEAGPGTEYRTS